MAPNSQLVQKGFFSDSNPRSSTSGTSISQVVRVDRDGRSNSAFHAVAAAVIDKCLLNLRIESKALNSVLTRYFEMCTLYHSKASRLVTPLERMQHVLKQVALSEVVESLASTLRLVALEALANQAIVSTKSIDFRAGSLSNDETEIAALAYSLDITIELKHMEIGKELFSKLKYNKNSNNALTLILQLQEGQFVPCLVNTRYFRTLNYSTENVINPIDGQINACAPTIDTSGNQPNPCIDTFNAVKNRLVFMINAGELNQHDLMAMHIKYSCKQDNNYVVGFERGYQHVWENWVDASQRLQLSQHEHITKLLVNSIAAAVSLNIMPAADIFSEMDNSHAKPRPR